VKEILTDGTIRPLNTTDGKYFTIAMSTQPPFYDIKEVIQSTTAQLSGSIITSGSVATSTTSQLNGITTGTNTAFT
jgi:hypothetical protein